MANLDDLKDELVNDPLGRGYSGMTDEQASNSLNVVNRTKNKTSMTGSEVANAVDIGEFNALSAGDEQLIWNVIHIGDIDPFGVEATIFTNVFGMGSATITSLAAARKIPVSRAQELNLGRIGPGLVTEARKV